MQLDNRQFTDPVAALREDVRSYLAENHVTQKALASLAQTTEQTLSDFLGKRGRGLQADTFARIQYLVSNNIKPAHNSGARLEHCQSLGKTYKGTVSLNTPEVKETRLASNKLRTQL
jgi:hypothetical protein